MQEMNPATSLVITSIAGSAHPVLHDYATQSVQNGIHFIVVGDVMSPDDIQIEGCDFYPLSRQQNLDYTLSVKLPLKNYARKNIGYLEAIRSGTRLIIETDDDNIPQSGFWSRRDAFIEAVSYEDTGWFNVYRQFTGTKIWPRGFPLEYINQPAVTTSREAQLHFCPIQQGLVDGDPDVDAIYRLTQPVGDILFASGQIVLGRNSWCPFNSQNTTWFAAAFPLLYLPSLCNFRLTDIWRSLVAQRICWENDWKILFHTPTLHQERNPHSLMDDFAKEINGYLYNRILSEKLTGLPLREGTTHIADNLLQCYRLFVDMKLLPKEELTLVYAWLNDIYKIL